MLIFVRWFFSFIYGSVLISALNIVLYRIVSISTRWPKNSTWSYTVILGLIIEIFNFHVEKIPLKNLHFNIAADFC